MDLSSLKDVYDSLGGADGIKKGVTSVSGIFSKKKRAEPPAGSPDQLEKSASSARVYSSELESLIELVIEDGEVADDEMELLSARAERDGIDPIEFRLVIKRRLKQKKAEAEMLKNPVNAIAHAFKIAEATAKGGKSIADCSSLSGALALIPGVGQVGAVASLAASLIKSPSNLNSLKAEIISHAKLPDDEKLLAEFMMFCHTQRELEVERKSASFNSISSRLSSFAVGSAIDLIPIWTSKIDQLIVRARTSFPQSEIIRNTIAMVYESPATRLRRTKANDIVTFFRELDALPVPDDGNELLEVISFLYENASEFDEIKEKHKFLYKIAEQRFADNESLLNQLKTYKIKKFGLF